MSDLTQEVVQKATLEVNEDAAEMIEDGHQYAESMGYTEEKDVTTGVARVQNVEIRNTWDENEIDITLFVRLPNGDMGRWSTEYSAESPDKLIDWWAFRGKISDASSLRGLSFDVEKQDETTWVWSGYLTPDLEFNKLSKAVTEDEIYEKTISDEEYRKFWRLVHTDVEVKKDNSPTSGEAIITDYYVRSSRSGIQQELEMGIEFKLPDGSTQMFEFLHGPEHPNEAFLHLEEHLNISEELYGLKGSSVQVKKLDTGDNSEWCFIVPNRNALLGTATIRYITQKALRTTHDRNTPSSIQPIVKTHNA